MSAILATYSVEVSGTVHSAIFENSFLNLYLAVGMARVRAAILNAPRIDLSRLVNARVTVHGAYGATFTNRRQLTGFVVHVQTLKDVAVSERVRSNPNALPLRRAADLLQFSPVTPGHGAA